MPRDLDAKSLVADARDAYAAAPRGREYKDKDDALKAIGLE
jgi:hypothetical protein